MSSIDLATAVIAGADGPAPVAGEGSLMAAVAEALTLETCSDDTRRTALKYWSEEARAAILAVADWLEAEPGDLGSIRPEWWIAQMLRREVEQ